MFSLWTGRPLLDALAGFCVTRWDEIRALLEDGVPVDGVHI